jgi:hypothetical protein
MRTLNSSKLFLGIAALFVMPLLVSAQEGESHIGKLSGHTSAGKQLYFRYCWGCHGYRGDGNGENAPYLNILPRNFVAATFKCRSTPTGTLPTDGDLYNSLGRGFRTARIWWPSSKLFRHDGRPTKQATRLRFRPSQS